VPDNDWLAVEFETHRARLRAVAYRMLGSPSEADDAVQESWLRLSRSGTGGVENLGGWLTTVVARVCLDMLRSRTSRREEPLDPAAPAVVEDTGPGINPEQEAVLADSVGLAMLVVLDTLAPAERVAFVLHDMFAVPFDEIGAILGRTPNATKQLASRARRRIEGAGAGTGSDAGPAAGTDPAAGLARQREVVGAFLAASRGGDFDALLALLAPDVVLRADAATVSAGAEPEVRGAEAVARTFAGRARAARLALVDGAVGLVWSQGGQPRVVFGFTVTGEQITGIELLGDPDRLSRLDLEELTG
jgi:RNA polymerase sigma factor (sigma-70 family)